MRLDVYLVTYWPDHSRATWQKYCKAGYVYVNGHAQTVPSFVLGEDDQVTLHIPPAPDHSQHTLPIIYEDDDVVVINKPAGMLTHTKGALNDEFTVADFIRPRTTDADQTNRPGIVHRLDRDTSGVMIAAKTMQAKRWLQKQFTERKVKKTYIALVQGAPQQPTALLQLPIERNPKKPQTFRVGASGKPAQTQYQTTQQFAYNTLLVLQPLTGRTHQLRVHMLYLGCPIVGDVLYGSAAKNLHRMFLHAAKLELTLPSRQRKVFEAPLPSELRSYLNTLQ